MGRKTLLVERYGFLGGMGTAAGVTNFCGLHANVHGETGRWCMASPTNCSRASIALGGLNEPHVVFGKIQAQAYDTAAYKCAADDLLLGRGVDILFHALGAGVVMDPDDTHPRADRRNQIGPRGRASAASSSTARATAISPPGPARRTSMATAQGGMLYPTMMFRLNGVDPGSRRRSLEHDPGADG